MITTNTLFIGGTTIILGATLAVLLARYYSKLPQKSQVPDIIPHLGTINFLEILKKHIQEHHLGGNKKLAAVLTSKNSDQQQSMPDLFCHTNTDECILLMTYDKEKEKVEHILSIIYFKEMDDAVREMFTDGILVAD